VNCDEIKLMRLENQHLFAGEEAVRSAGDLCGLQAQFFSNAMHALKIRSTPFEGVPDGLVKSWTLRGTMHLFPEQDLPLMLHEGRVRKLRPCDTMNSDERITAQRKRYFSEIILEKIQCGVCEREALKTCCFAAGMTDAEAESIFNAWGGLLRALCEEGKICHKAQEKKAFKLCPPFIPMQKEEAELELARRYFLHYGPATVKDAVYFFGTTQAAVKRWISRLPVSEMEYQGKRYFWCGESHLPAREIPKCLFLAGFDPLMMGYEKKESLFLPPESLRRIFTLAGIVTPSLLLGGRVKARWKKTGKRVSVVPFEKLSPSELQAMEENAAELWPDFEEILIVEA